MTQELAHRLLLVEDNPGDALLVSEALAEFHNHSLSLEPVTSLKQALEALDTHSFDGIILDLTLPDSRGVDTLARVAEATEAVPIVVLTGLDGGGGLREKAEELGAFEFVCKNEMAQLLPRSVYWSLRHKRAEARHREFERLVSAIPDAVVVTDRAGVVHFVNDAAFELFGKRGEGFLGQPIGFAVKVGTVSEIEIRRSNESRACEMRAVACQWNGVPAALVLLRDMTEQKRLSGQLQHAQKMEAIGMMAGGIAHDFNNLLLVMLVHAELLRDDCDPADERLAGVFEIIQSIERAQALTRQLLAFSRKQPSETTVVNLGEVVGGVHSMLRRMLSTSIEIVTLAGDELWPVRVDRGQIEQVLMNMAVNARDAMPSGGRFAIEIENRALTGAGRDALSGDYVAMRVSDTGVGIEAQHLGRVFDPFFTTKDRGRGTGLGLSMCYGIVAQAGGDLTVESKVGAGTTFTILLPRSRETAGHSVGDRVEHEGLSGRETILIVEDDQAVMRATAATLRKGGYTVLTASNGDEARRLVQPRADGIDLVLSDVVMPQLSGPEFAEYLASIRPDIPLIFMTGYSEYPVSSVSGDNRIANHRAIMKPFRPRDLLSTIREVLDARAQAAA